jgi:energy-coupling factor transport system permease protein
MGLGASQQFGRYVAVESRLHSLDPLVKMAVFLVVMASVFAAGNWQGLVAVAVFVVALCLLSRVRIFFYAESLKYFSWMFALSFAINVIFPRDVGTEALSRGAIAVAGLMAARLAVMILAAAVFTMVTAPSEIGEGVMILARVRGRVGRKAADFASVVSMALRFVPVMFEEAERIKAARMLRGGRPRGLTGRVRFVIDLVVPLLDSSLRRATNLGFALGARCYGYRLPTSRGIRLGANEGAFLAGAIVLLLLTVKLR